MQSRELCPTFSSVVGKFSKFWELLKALQNDKVQDVDRVLWGQESRLILEMLVVKKEWGFQSTRKIKEANNMAFEEGKKAGQGDHALWGSEEDI